MILSILEDHTAGSPVDSSIKWTHLTPVEIGELYRERSGKSVSVAVVKRFLRQSGYVKRKPSKGVPLGQSPYREEQFALIFFLIALLTQMGHCPIISVDTKKKERLGLLTRNQGLWSNKAVPVYDHDYDYLSKGKVVPHGIYDLALNKGYMTIGTNHETAAFIADNLIWWWESFGINHYPDGQYILVLCDSGGANSYRHYSFKKELLRVAQTIGKTLIIAHYPPYQSKYNPIERKLFSHVHSALSGSIFTSYEQVEQLMKKTKTKAKPNPLSVEVRIQPKFYPKGLKTDKEELDWRRVLFHEKIPLFNYTIKP